MVSIPVCIISSNWVCSPWLRHPLLPLLQQVQPPRVETPHECVQEEEHLAQTDELWREARREAPLTRVTGFKRMRAGGRSMYNYAVMGNRLSPPTAPAAAPSAPPLLESLSRSRLHSDNFIHILFYSLSVLLFIKTSRHTYLGRRLFGRGGGGVGIRVVSGSVPAEWRVYPVKRHVLRRCRKLYESECPASVELSSRVGSSLC